MIGKRLTLACFRLMHCRVKTFVADLQRALSAEGDDAAAEAYEGALAANARAAGGEAGEGGEAYNWLDPGATPFEFRALAATLRSAP